MKKLLRLALAALLAASIFTMTGCDENTAFTQDDQTEQEKNEILSSKEAFDLLQKTIHEKDFTMVEVIAGKMTVDGVVKDEVSADENTTTVNRDGNYLYVKYPERKSLDYFIDLDQMIQYILYKSNFDDRAEKLAETDANDYLDNYFDPFGGSEMAIWSADLFDEYDSAKQYYPVNTEKLTAALTASLNTVDSVNASSINSCSGYLNFNGSNCTVYIAYDCNQTMNGQLYNTIASITRTYTFADTTVKVPENLPTLSEEN